MCPDGPCEKCRRATGKEEMCGPGREAYVAYCRSIVGEEAWSRMEQEKAECRRRTAEDDAAHPEWSIETQVNHGCAIWVNSITGERVGCGLTGRPWLVKRASGK